MTKGRARKEDGGGRRKEEEKAKEVEEAGEGVVVQWNRNEIGGRQKHRRKGR